LPVGNYETFLTATAGAQKTVDEAVIRITKAKSRAGRTRR
jgi:hypothetical protein